MRGRNPAEDAETALAPETDTNARDPTREAGQGAETGGEGAGQGLRALEETEIIPRTEANPGQGGVQIPEEDPSPSLETGQNPNQETGHAEDPSLNQEMDPSLSQETDRNRENDPDQSQKTNLNPGANHKRKKDLVPHQNQEKDPTINPNPEVARDHEHRKFKLKPA